MTLASTTALITAPAEKALSLARLKDFLRVKDSKNDGILEDHLDAAIAFVQEISGQQLVTATWEDYFDCFADEMALRHPPLVSITHVKYVDTEGATQTLSSSYYTVDTVVFPGRIRLAYNCLWPSTRLYPNAVTVRYVCGYGAASAVPAAAVSAIQKIVRNLFDGAMGDGSLTEGAIQDIEMLGRVRTFQ